MTAAAVEEQAQEQLELVRGLAETHQTMRAEIGKRIIGQGQVLDDILITILAQGHALLIGVPGLAKTMMVSTVAEIMDLGFTRIQFTPDLMPADITGTEVLEEDRSTGKRVFRFVKGPVFTNIVLADEINRTPPKTQAALLEAMQEHSVSVASETHPLPRPFFVLATQNPIEQEGTYPLPEAQLDRFMFSLLVDYPSADEELAIALTTTGEESGGVDKLLNGEQLVELQQLVRRVRVSEHVGRFAVKLVRATRPNDDSATDFVRQFVRWGAGPRAVQYLVLGAKASAVLQGTTNVSCDHVRAIAPMVLRHRVLTNFAAEAEGIDADQAVRQLLEQITEDKS